MRHVKQFILFAALGVALLATPASAQFQSYTWNGTTAVGDMAYVINTTDSSIVDGSLVVLDTTSVVKRIGVRNYIPGTTSRSRIVGIAVGAIQRSSNGGNGKILLRGYHPSALVGASNLANGNDLKFSLSVTGSFALGDTLTGIVARVLGGNAGTVTGPRYTYKIWFWGASKLAGASI